MEPSKGKMPLNVISHRNVCSLCDAPLPRKPVRGQGADEDKLFCCTGCFHVYNLLKETGVGKDKFKESSLYQISEKLGILQNTETVPESEISEAILGNLDESENLMEVILQIEGVWCSSCTWIIEKVLSEQPGVLKASVSFSTDTATISYNPIKTSKKSIISVINKLGYGATLRGSLKEKGQKEFNNLLLKTGVSFFLFMNIMYFSSVLYVGYFEQLNSSMRRLAPIILLVLCIPVVTWCGSVIHKMAYYSIKNRNMAMELLLSISILSSFFFSVYSLIMGYEHVYFDTSTGLVTLMLTGKLIEASAKQKAMENINRLYQMLPGKARIKKEDGYSLVSINELKVDDIYLVKEGEKFPTDAIIEKGNTTVDESMLTGESTPVIKKAGDVVYGSTINYESAIEAKVTSIGGDSVISRIIKMVEASFAKKSKIEEIVNRFTRFFIPSVLIMSIITFIIIYVDSGLFENALLRGITVLVVACPCALGIATPLAIIFGIGRASKEGMLVRDGSVLQHMGMIKKMVFDKTGTITDGNFHVKEIYSDIAGDDVISIIASIENYSNHSIAKTIVRYCKEKELSLYDIKDVKSFPGMGISGNVIKKGKKHSVKLGNARYLTKSKTKIPREIIKRGDKEEEEGSTVVYFSIDNKKFGYIALMDTLKKNTGKVVESLKSMGISLMLLSGDSEKTTSKVAELAGIPEHKAEVVPEEKLSIIEELKNDGSNTAMVGDGVNDAPALAQADTGIAMGSGTEIAIESSDVVMMRNDLTLIPQVIKISKFTIKVIKLNLLWAFIYNVFGVFLAIKGVLNPLLAAFAMVLSSLSVTGNSLRIRRMKLND